MQFLYEPEPKYRSVNVKMSTHPKTIHINGNYYVLKVSDGNNYID